MMFPDYRGMYRSNNIIQKIQRLIKDLNLLKYWKSNKTKGYQVIQYINDESDNGGTSDTLASLYRDIDEDSRIKTIEYEGLDNISSNKWGYTIRTYSDDIEYLLDNNIYIVNREIDDLLYMFLDFKEGLNYTYIGHYELHDGLIRILLDSDYDLYKLDHYGTMESVNEVISLFNI